MPFPTEEGISDERFDRRDRKYVTHEIRCQMKTHSILVAVSLACIGIPARAQQTTLAVDAPSLKILDSQEVDLGDHKITYNRVEVPKLKPEAVKTISVPVDPVPMTAEEEAAMKAWESKFQEALFFGVVVYDGNYSEIRWWEDGQENVVWSNVNFLHFAPMPDLETDKAYYSLMLWGWETTSEEVRAMNAEAKSPLEMTALPPSELPPLGEAGPKWMAQGKLSEAAVRAMEDFHEYYHLHGVAMAEDYKRREAEAKAHEEWVKAHPPIPQDTTVNFFPIRSVHAPKIVPIEENIRK